MLVHVTLTIKRIFLQFYEKVTRDRLFFYMLHVFKNIVPSNRYKWTGEQLAWKKEE